MKHASQSHQEAGLRTTLLSPTTSQIGTWNVRTMYEAGKTAQVEAEMRHYKVTNEELCRQAGQDPVDLQMKKRKWGWLGYTLRKPAINITRQALKWNPQGKRKQGRPRTTWRRSTVQEAQQLGYSWGQLEVVAQDRMKWRSLVSDLCPSLG